MNHLNLRPEVQPCRESEIPSQLNRLDKLIDDLRGITSSLCERLIPVTEQQSPTPSGSVLDPQKNPPLLSELGMRLAAYNNRLEDAITQLHTQHRTLAL